MSPMDPSGSKATTCGSNVVHLDAFRAPRDHLEPFLKTWALDRLRIESSAAEIDARERVERLEHAAEGCTDFPRFRLIGIYERVLTEMIRQVGLEEAEDITSRHIELAWAGRETKEG